MIWLHRALLLLTKAFSHVFYRTEVAWVGDVSPDPWREEIRLMVLLNHTSLFEPLYLSAFPLPFVWSAAPRTIVPGANKTLDRPWVGRFLKLLMPGLISVSRKRDDTWSDFLEAIGPTAIVAIAPEGRMLRRNGLDAEGNPLTVRGGVADVLARLKHGKMLILYSGGLHHVQAPGEFRVGLFKTLRLNFELVDIAQYNAGLGVGSPVTFRENVIRDLELRKRQHVPAAPVEK